MEPTTAGIVIGVIVVCVVLYNIIKSRTHAGIDQSAMHEINRFCDNSLVQNTKALNMHRANGNQQGEAVLLGEIGDIYRIKGDLDNALSHCSQSLSIHRTIGNKKGEAKTLKYIGMVYKDKGEHDYALDHFNQALGVYNQIGAIREIKIVEENIARVKKEMKKRGRKKHYPFV